MDYCNMKPKISVIVIGYNIEQFIDECLESVFRQSYTNYEVVFVNDGSTDRTLKIAKKYEQEKGLIIVDKPNGGIVSARKAGVIKSSGDYLCFIDGDDWLNDDMLLSLVNAFSQSNSEPDIVCSGFNWQTEDGTFIVQSNVITDDYNSLSYFNGIMSNDIDHHMFPKLYKKDFVLKCGYLDYQNVTMAEDLMTNALFGLYDPIVVFSQDVNYYYRFNTSSVIRKGDEKLLEQIKTLSYLEKKLQEHYTGNNSKELMEYQWFSYAMGYLKRAGNYEIKKEIFDKCRTKFGDVESNSYAQRELANTQGRYARLFYTYYYHENISAFHDKMLFTLLGMYKKIRKKIRGK